MKPCELLEPRLHLSHVTLADAVPLPVGAQQDFVTSADFNGDGHADLVASSFSSKSLSLLFGNGDGTFAAPRRVNLGAAPDFVTSADFNNDSNADLLCVSFSAGTVSLYLGTGRGTFLAVRNFSAGSGSRAAAVADLSGDGVPDLALAKSFDQRLTILYGQTGGTFGSPQNTTLSFTPSDIVAGDFNSDGRADLAAADFFSNSVHLLINAGGGNFSDAASFATDTGPSAIAAADLNRDGKLDLVTANFLGNDLSVALGSGSGTFGAAVNLAAGHGSTFVAIDDIDGDGNADLISADANDDTISLLAGVGDGTFEPRITRATGTSPRSLVGSDINGDGAPDVACANQSDTDLSLFLSDASRPAGVVDAAPPVTTSGGTTCDFSIRYSDNIAMDAGSLDGGDIAVTGPGGFLAPAALVSVSPKTNAAQQVATYRINAPGTFWEPSDNGTYWIHLMAAQVADSAGNFAATGRIGAFKVKAADAGNTLETAQPMGAMSAGRVRAFEDYIGTDDRNDFYSFSLAQTTHVYGKISGMVDDADLQLLSSSGKRIAYSKRSGSAIEYFDLDLPAGTYYARVIFSYGKSGTGYRLRLEASQPLPPPTDNNTLQTAQDLGGLAPGVVRAVDAFVGNNDRNDFFRFTTNATASLYAKLSDLADDADLQLLDSAGSVLGSSKHSGTSIESIKRKLSADSTYYVRVLFKNGVRGTAYHLRLAL